MAGGGEEPEEGVEYLVTVVNNLGNIGGKPKGFGDVIQGGGVGGGVCGNYFPVGDVGYDPPHGTVPRGDSAKGGQTDYRESSPTPYGKKLELPPFGGGDAEGRV